MFTYHDTRRHRVTEESFVLQFLCVSVPRCVVFV